MEVQFNRRRKAFLELSAHPDVRCALHRIAVQTDRLFAVLMLAEWLVGGVFGGWPALQAGGFVILLPLLGVVVRPGSPITRYSIAISQMLIAALLVQWTGGRIEGHLLFFGLLAFLGVYRDWRALVLAAVVTTFDHVARVALWPQWSSRANYGDPDLTPRGMVMHIAYVAFEAGLLFVFVRQSLREMEVKAAGRAALEAAHAQVSQKVVERTSELTRQVTDRRRAADRLEMLNEVAQLLASDQIEDDVLGAALQKTARGLGYGWSGLWVMSVESGNYRLRAGWCSPDPRVEEMGRASKEEGLASDDLPVEDVVHLSRPLWIGGFPADSFARAPIAARAGLCNWVGVPVTGSSGTRAVWELMSNHAQEPDQAHFDCLQTAAQMLARYLERQGEKTALEDSERRYRVLFENNPCPMLVIDRETLAFLAVNREALRLYGYSENEFLSLRGPDIHPPEDVPNYLEHAQRVREAESTAVHTRRGRHVTRSGAIIDIDSTHYRIEWNGRDTALVMINDVTERLRMERERNAMELQLRHSQKLESIGQLAAGVAHEINTPGQYVGDNLRFLKDSFGSVAGVLALHEKLLASVEGAADVASLAAEIRAEDERADMDYLRTEIPLAIDQALDGIGQVATIVAAMKEFSHPGKKEKTLADLRQSIESTVVVSRNEWKYAADLETDFDPALPPVPCLVSEINQVVLNLIVNASHAIQEKSPSGERGKIAVRTRRRDNWAEIQVEDTGGGIPDAIREKIFDPFFTTKEVGRGTGQGLAIARSVIVDKHGGTIRFESTPGEGTIFYVRLPLALEAETVVA